MSMFAGSGRCVRLAVGVAIAGWLAGGAIRAAEPAAAPVPASLETAAPPAEKPATEAANRPDAPRRLNVDEANLLPAHVLPAGPLFYLEAPNGKLTLQALAQTPIARLLKHPRMELFLKNNPLSLMTLFTDLPPAYSNPDHVALLQAAGRLAEALAGGEGRLALSAFREPDGRVALIFLAEIGRDRAGPHELLQAEVEQFLAEYPAFLTEDAAHGDDYLDVLRAEDGRAELAYGVARNFAVVATSVTLARDVLGRATAGGSPRSLLEQAAYREISARTDGRALVRGFIDLAGLYGEAARADLPGAREMLDFACDVGGRGVVFYSLRVENDRLVEELAAPTVADNQQAPGLPRRVAQVCRDGEGGGEWSTARLAPYQTDFFLGARVKPAEFTQLLSSPQALGGSDYMLQLLVKLPPAFKHVLTLIPESDLPAALTGEIGLAVMNSSGGNATWLFILGIKDYEVASSRLATGEALGRQGSQPIYSLSKSELEKSECWSLFPRRDFPALEGSYAVVASSGEVMGMLIDQAVAASANLTTNRDFDSLLRALGSGTSLFWYYNLPGQIGREYVNFNELFKDYFPRLGTVVNRPPLSVFTLNLVGLSGVARLDAAGDYCRQTVVSPLGLAPALSSLLVANLPRWTRERARVQLSRSRANLGRQWLELQTYATQRGSFPENFEELQAAFPETRRAEIFTSPAALAELAPEAALAKSYAYVPGLRNTDEPDMPIVYEAVPWHWEYTGMMPPPGKTPQETGTYTRWRLVLRIDGVIEAYSENDFQRYVWPRIAARLGVKQ